MVQKGCAEGVREDALTLDGLHEVVRLFLNNMQVGREGGREGGGRKAKREAVLMPSL
jgi:hypothetical protein